MQEGAEDFEKKAQEHVVKRNFMNQIRPPQYWNFFEDGKEEERVKHVLRYDADPTKAYVDGRIAMILQSIEEIGANLKNYEEIKWKQLSKIIYTIFEHDYAAQQAALAEPPAAQTQ